MPSAPLSASGPGLPELSQSARKHYRRDRLDDSSVLYAAVHVLTSRPLDDEDDPRRWLMIGTDPAGRLGVEENVLHSLAAGFEVFVGVELVESSGADLLVETGLIAGSDDDG